MPDSKRVSARAVLLMPDETGRSCIALMHRIRPDDEHPGSVLDYYVTPGGGVEAGEGIPQAAEREVWEELGLRCRAGEEIFRRIDDTHDEHVLWCSYEGGVFGTGCGPEFTAPDAKKGAYLPALIPFSELEQLPLVPQELKQLLLARSEGDM